LLQPPERDFNRQSVTSTARALLQPAERCFNRRSVTSTAGALLQPPERYFNRRSVTSTAGALLQPPERFRAGSRAGSAPSDDAPPAEVVVTPDMAIIGHYFIPNNPLISWG
jgi:hypothetical protein